MLERLALRRQAESMRGAFCRLHGLDLRLCLPVVRKFAACLVLGAAVAAASAFPHGLGSAQAADADATALLDVALLKPGAKGYGLTVFSGTEPERFEVEVIGVLKTFLPNQDLILIKTRHPRLDVVKVVGGMSGSPIFIDGKLVGAYAYGWQFGVESVAGVTPIKGMLEELRRPIPPEYLLPLRSPGMRLAWRGGSGRPAAVAEVQGPGDYDVRAHVREIAAHMAPAGAESLASGPVPVGTPLMVSGVGETTLHALRDLVSPLGLEVLQGGGAGGVDSTAPTRYVDGGAIGVQIVRGDIAATAIGTVTHVMGDRLIAFGHPMMQAGVTRLPTCVAKIQWVMASMLRSFKVGMPVRPLGSLINDRQAAIVVDSKIEPPVIPVRLSVTGVPGAPHPNWSMEVAHERFMTPTFVAIAIGNAIDATTREHRDVSWHAYTTIGVRGHGLLTLHDFGVSSGGTPDAGTILGSRAVRSVGTLLNNPWEPVTIENVETKLDIRFVRDLLTLRGAEPLETEVDAGRRARIRLHLVPYAGPEQIRVVEVDIPRELAGEWVEIEIAAGHQTAPDVAKPENLRELIANLPKQSMPPDVLVTAVKVGGQAVAFKGQVASRLPPGAIDTLRSASSTVAPEPIPSYVRTVIPLNHFVSGKDSVKIHVRNVLR